MDERFYQYYERELQHLRSGAEEFASAFPKIAARLSMKDVPCPDPYVERLLEGFAFLAARVQLKLDSEFPRFTDHLLGTLYPHLLAPSPSATVVEFVIDRTNPGLASGYAMPRGSILRTPGGAMENTPVEFRTAHEVTLLPLMIKECQYLTREIGALGVNLGKARAALRIVLKTTANVPIKAVNADDITLFLRGSDSSTRPLHYALLAKASGIIFRGDNKDGSKRTLTKDASSIEPVGFAEDQALLPSDPRSFHGFRLLREYFMLPERYMFVKIGGFRELIASAEGDSLEIIIPFAEEDLQLEAMRIDARNISLHCTPAINLFSRLASPIFVTDRRPEHRVVVDVKNPFDHEIYSVTSVTGYGQGATDVREFRPFHAVADDEHDDGHAYYTTHRLPRAVSDTEKRQGPRSRLYRGSEVFVSIVDSAAAPHHTDLRQLSLHVLATNRDLPLQMPLGLRDSKGELPNDPERDARPDLLPLNGGPIKRTMCVVRPSLPRNAMGQGQPAWRAINHLAVSQLALGDSSGSPAAMRELLRLFSDVQDPVHLQQIEGLTQVKAETVFRRVPSPGPIAFARGLEIALTFDERLYQDAGCFLIASVIDRVLARYASINSFIETVARTTDQREINRWTRSVGTRPMI